MKRKIIEIDGKQVAFKASAAIPRIYRIQFHRDIFVDLQKVSKSVMKSQKKKAKNHAAGDIPVENIDTENNNVESNEIPVEDLSMFEQIAYIMAKHADPQNVPDDIMDWLDEYDTFSIYKVLPAILELWSLNEQSQIQAKKNLDKVAGN